MKESKTAVTTVGEDATRDRILLGVPGKRFKFDSDASNVTFTACSVRTGDLTRVVDFIHSDPSSE
jgi:hypothetical protein